MFCTKVSLLLSAACIIIFSRLTGAADIINCYIPRNFTVELSNQQRANIYQSELDVLVENNGLTVISYPGINSVNVRAPNIMVAFKGYLMIHDVDRGISTQPERISAFYTDRLSGVARRAILNVTDSTIYDCRIVLLPTEANRPRINRRIVNEIRRLAESCVELNICQRIHQIKSQDMIMMESPSTSESGLLSVYRDPLAIRMESPSRETLKSESSVDTKFNSVTVQSTINKLVDIALAEILEKLKEKNEGTVDVPNIDKHFSTGSGIFKTTGHFEAVDGKFRDLTTIRRASDAILSHEGMKFLASCGFRLEIANLDYDHYRLKYGIIKVNGKMSGKMAGMALQMGVSADYTQTPCLMNVEHLNVTEFGKIKIHLTGLGPLNSLASKLFNWITEKWHDDIVHKVEKKIRKIVQTRLSAFNCERFRP